MVFECVPVVVICLEPSSPSVTTSSNLRSIENQSSLRLSGAFDSLLGERISELREGTISRKRLLSCLGGFGRVSRTDCEDLVLFDLTNLLLERVVSGGYPSVYGRS